ncbi:MAG: glycosyltransferase [Gammaproteobacteria bacterium]|nr:glycosyltransferase [Gammaproteobacteria bacterium]
MTRPNKTSISVVIACHNEESSIAATLAELARQMAPRFRWEVVVVNDGSTDRTLDVLQSVPIDGFERVVVDLSRNFGKESALTAGLDHASDNAVVVMDADLQDPLCCWSESHATKRVPRSCSPSAWTAV